MGRDSRGRCAGVGRVRLTRASLETAACVVGYNPKANEAFHAAAQEADVAPDVASALARADGCIAHNDWPEWRRPRSEGFPSMRRKLIIDGRRILDREALEDVDLGS